MKSWISKRNNVMHFALFSVPRSGTTWMKAMLNQHPDIHCTEFRLFGNSEMAAFNKDGNSDFRLTADRYARKLSQHMTKPENLPDRNALSDELTNSITSMLLDFVKSRTNAKVLVDKVTPYMRSEKETFAAYRRVFPQAKIIFLMRDCRDVAVSGMFHWHHRLTSALGRSEFEVNRMQVVTEQLSKSSLETAFRAGELEDWVNSWVTISELERQFSKCTIRYEDLLVSPEITLEKLFKFLHVSLEKKLIAGCVSNTSFEVMSGGRSRGEAIPDAHVRKGVRGDWKRYLTRKDGQLLDKLAGKELLNQGYVQNGDWVAELHQNFAFREDLKN